MKFVELVDVNGTRIKLNTAHVVAIHASAGRTKTCCVVTTVGNWDVKGNIEGVAEKFRLR